MEDQQRRKALIIDDEKVVSDFLVRFLNHKGITTRSVTDGLNGIEAMGAEKFDYVFLDIRMPGIDGVQTLKRLKAINPDCKYIVMTGYSVDHLIEEAKKEGIFAAVKKPFDINQLISFLERQVVGIPEAPLPILVVDDEKGVRDFFERILEKKNFEVTCVDSAKKALEAVSSGKPYLVFLDIVLKDGNGVELCSKMFEVNSSIKVIFITGREDIEDEIKHLTVSGCLFKPFVVEEVIKEIEKVQREKKPPL